MTPTVHRCASCAAVVIVAVTADVWCLRCGVRMRPVPIAKPPPVARAGKGTA